MIVCCCVCGQVRVDSVWREPFWQEKIEIASGASHTYCPEHLAELQEEIQQDKGEK